MHTGGAGCAKSLPHYRGAFAQSGELQKLRLAFHQMDCCLAFVAKTHKRRAAQEFQTVPTLSAVAIQMAMDSDVHGTAI